MAKRRWKPKEIRKVLLQLGFIEKKGRGKGDHRMYFKTVEVAPEKAITLITMLDMGSNIISPKVLKSILQSTRLDIQTLERAFSGQYHRRDYEDHLLRILQ